MKHLTILLLSLLFTGCASLYPLGGSVVGAGTGAVVGGPGGAAVGAGIGWGAGKGVQLAKENKDLGAQVNALTEGDVDTFIELKLKEKKESGFFDSMLDGVYSFIKLAILLLVLWNALPLIWNYLLHRKLKATNGDTKKNKK